MLFSGKENVFMCLVAFQNIFRKIVSGVWKRRRKRQNPEKPGQTQKNTAQSRDRRSDLAIDGAISDRDRHERCFTRSRRRIAIEGAISRSTVHINRDLANGASRELSLCDLAFFLSLSFSLCASPVSEIIWSENRNGNEFPWSTLLFYGQLKMISGKFNFPNQPNSLFYGKWFPKMIFSRFKHSLNLLQLQLCSIKASTIRWI